jgi:hypothetical protein
VEEQRFGGILNERFRNAVREIDVRGIVGCESKEHWQKIRIYMAKLKRSR